MECEIVFFVVSYLESPLVSLPFSNTLYLSKDTASTQFTVEFLYLIQELQTKKFLIK